MMDWMYMRIIVSFVIDLSIEIPKNCEDPPRNSNHDGDWGEIVYHMLLSKYLTLMAEVNI